MSYFSAYNKDVNEHSNIIQSDIQSEEVTYESANTVVKEDEALIIKFFNSLVLPETPPHALHLKIGAKIIMFQNIHQSNFCNGTRLAVKNNEQCRIRNNLDRPFKR